MISRTFEIICSIIDESNLINRLYRYVNRIGGKIEYSETGKWKKKMRITVFAPNDKYGDVRYLCKRAIEIYNMEEVNV